MYENGKIYKLQCEDGYFYIGSTCNPLCKRIANHRQESKTNTNKLYSHIKEIGWNRVKIVLIENVYCKNKEELRKKEDEHIQQNRNNPFCLNTLRSFVSTEERNKVKTEYNRTLQSYQDRLIEKKKKIVCSCGKEISQGHLNTHIKTKYHNNRNGGETETVLF